MYVDADGLALTKQTEPQREMKMTKNNQDFQDFLRDEVNLNQSRLDRLNTSVRAVDSYLKDHLTGYQKMERQGSYALGTLIKPVDDNDEYDADIQIVMNPNAK